MLARCALPAALATALAMLATSSWAQQSPGLSAKPSGRTLAEPTAPPAEQPVDLSRPNPQGTLDATSSEDLYFDAAMRGDAWAQTKLGKAYLEQSDDTERRQKGIELLKMAAAQKDAEAIYLLANATTADLAGQMSNIPALSKLEEAAELGSAEAQYQLASIYAEGIGVERNIESAIKWGSKAADQGKSEAQLATGQILIESSNPERKAKALEYLQSAVEAGNTGAVLFLASAVGNGRFDLPKDESRAEALLKPWAEKGNADCQFVLAALYKFGESFAHRRNEAYVWMRRAADQGHTDALKILESEER
jgi:TPR repeat protein